MSQPFPGIQISRRSFLSGISGLAASFVLAWTALGFLLAMAVPVPAAAQTTTGTDQDKYCFSMVQCHKDMTGKSQCKSGAGCCVEDRCFVPGEGCQSRGGTNGTMGRCYAKSPPITLAVKIGSTSRVIDIGDYLETAYNYGVGIAGFLAAIMMMIGGFLYLTAGADQGRVTKGKTIIVDALLGLGVTLSAYLMLQTINPNILNLQLPKVPIIKRTPFAGCELTQLCRGCGAEYGLTQAYLDKIAAGQTVEAAGAGQSNSICGSQYVVDANDPKSMTTCIGQSCNCATLDGGKSCPDSTNKCLKTSAAVGLTKCADVTAAAKSSTAGTSGAKTGSSSTASSTAASGSGYGCYSCWSEGTQGCRNGRDPRCCTGYCAGEVCTAGQPGDPCGKSFFLKAAIEDYSKQCVTGICSTPWLDSNFCTSGTVGSPCASKSECKTGYCNTLNYTCTDGSDYSLCWTNGECKSGNCFHTDDSFSRWSFLSPLTGQGASKIGFCLTKSALTSTVGNVAIPSTGKQITLGWSVSESALKGTGLEWLDIFGTGVQSSGDGYLCNVDNDCPKLDQEGAKFSRPLLNLKQCLSEKKWCTTGNIGTYCDKDEDCNNGHCAYHLCTSMETGAPCDDMQDCSSTFCNFVRSGAGICVSGGPGSRCSNDKRCQAGLECQGPAGKERCLPGKSCPSK